MALMLGELAGVITLDDKPFQKGLGNAQGKLEGFGAKGKVIAAAAGVAIGAALAAGIASAMNVDKAKDKLNAQLGLTGKDAEKAGKAAGKLYAGAYGASMEEVTGAVGAVMSSIKGMRTASQADVEKMTAKVLDLAAAFEIDAGRAAQVAGQMITSGLAKDGVEAADLLTASLQKVPAAVREDLLDAVDEYGPFMKTLGITGDKAMGMLVTASEKGMYGIDKTGDALKEFGIRATDMSKATGGAYDAIGLDQGVMTNKLLAGGDDAAEAFQTIVDGIQGIKDPAARSQAALALFGTPLEDLSVTDIPKFLDSLDTTKGGLGDVAGAADEMGATLNDNASTNLETFRRGLEMGITDALNNHVVPAINDAAKWVNVNLVPALQNIGDFIVTEVNPALQKFSAFIQDNKDKIATIAGVIGVILLPALVRLGVGALIAGGQQVTAWLMAQGGAIKAAVVYVAQSFLIIGRWVAMGAAALVSGAQTTYVWALYKLEAIKGAVAYGVQAARVAAAWVVMSAAAVVSGIKTAAVWTGTVVGQAVKGAIAFVIQAGKVAAGWVVMSAAAIKSGAKTAAVWTGTVVAQAATGAINFLIHAGKVVGGWLLMSTQSLIHAGRMALAWFIALGPIGWVIAAVLGLVAIIILNWDKISAFTKDMWEKHVKPIFDNLARFITKDVPKAFENGVKWIGEEWAKLMDLAKKPVKFVVEQVINKGLIDGMNGIGGLLGMKPMAHVKLPDGFRDGGYTGNIPKGAVAGAVHGDEHVIKSPSRRKFERRHPGVLEHINQTGALPGYRNGGRVAPLKHLAVTQGYNRVHKGIDYAAAEGTPVFATQNGTVSHAGPGARAPGVWGGTEIHIAGSGLETWFAHLSRIGVGLGQKVRAGQQIGLSGNTGITSGPHLHFGVFNGGWPNDLDPNSYLGGAGVPSGGTGGGFNPISGIIDGLVSKFKDQFPGGGIFADMAIGIGKKILDGASKWVTDTLGGGDKKGNTAGPTVYDGGGWLENTGGPQLVQHNKSRPDAVLSDQQWADIHKLALGNAGGGMNYSPTYQWMGEDPHEVMRKDKARAMDLLNAYT
jgi:phage-related minor tail protein